MSQQQTAAVAPDDESVHRGFRETGQTAHRQTTFRWLDRVDAHPLAREVKQTMLTSCPVRPGDRVLDVGCGLGHEVMRLAPRVVPGGHIVGVDVSRPMIDEARRRAAETPLPVSFRVGNVNRLRFPDETFDLARTERVLRYLASPLTALWEMARVVRRGGTLLAFDFDSDQTIVDAPDVPLARRVGAVLDAAVPSPWIGRQLFGLFKRVGLLDVRLMAHPIVLTGADGFAMYRQLNRGTLARAVHEGHIGAGDVDTWWAALDQSARTNTFFSVNLGVIVSGRKA
jgi:ubiquinone/menaquinone biosynthesis C-methylase UbiE